MQIKYERVKLYGRSIKKLRWRLKVSGGRNNSGRTTVFHRGGTVKRYYRVVDFKRLVVGVPAVIRRVEYDPNRNSFLLLVCYMNGFLSYLLAPMSMKVGDFIINGDSFLQEVGNTLTLNELYLGSLVHNIELYPGSGGKLVRAAGLFAQVLKRYGLNNEYTLVKFPSGEYRLLSGLCRATLGIVSNIDNRYLKLVKAGQSRWLGFRPSVRGVAKNPVDHPHGGGEGKGGPGRPSVSRWGVLAKGFRTRKKNKINKFVAKRHYNKEFLIKID